MIAGKECEGCIYLTEINNRKILCDARGREYYYGQYIPCEEKDGKNRDKVHSGGDGTPDGD